MFSSILVSDNEVLFRISTLIGLYWLSFLPGTPNAPYAPSPHDQTSPAIELTIVKYYPQLTESIPIHLWGSFKLAKSSTKTGEFLCDILEFPIPSYPYLLLPIV